MIANCCLPLSLPGNRHFQLGLQKLEAKATTVSRTVMMDKYLPRCAKMVADFVAKRIRGKTVCLVIDEMSKSGMSFVNLLLCTGDDGSLDMKNQVYFWDCTCLPSNNAISLGSFIANTIRDLEALDVTVNFYSSDNCRTMVAALEYAERKCGRELVRVPCASHVMNLIFKDLVNHDCIKNVWANVIAYKLNDRIGKQGKQDSTQS